MLSRFRVPLTRLSARPFSISVCRLEPKVPKPPRGVDDSTSALDYKHSHKVRPPPLPVLDLPREISAEEAVSNILYNTPPPSLQPFKRHILNCLVQNEPGVLSRVSGILAGRGFNIDSLVVCQTEIKDLSRMCIVLSGQDGVVEQARRQLEDLVPVWAVLDYTETTLISRELLLVKISILGPEYFEDQLVGGPSHSPRTERWSGSGSSRSPISSQSQSDTETETENSKKALAQSFENSGHPSQARPASLALAGTGTYNPAETISPSELLRRKHQHLQSIANLASQFGGKLVDVSENSVIVELAGKTSRVEAFLKLVQPFGVLESARTGLMVMPRTPIISAETDDAGRQDSDAVDATLLPPG